MWANRLPGNLATVCTHCVRIQTPVREILLNVLLILVVNSCLAAQTGAKTINAEEKLFTASKIYALVQLHFASLRSSDYDLDSSYKNYLRAILAKDERREFDLATFKFVAERRSGHTLFWDSWLDNDLGQPLGFYAAPIENKWVVFISSMADLRPGDTIVGIDGHPTEEFAGQQVAYISASSDTARRRNLFLLPYLFPKQFTLTLEDGRKVVVDRTTTKLPDTKTGGHWLKQGQVAYIRIPSFFYPVLEDAALSYVNQFRNAKVLIIDVRNNPGGISAARFVQALMDRSYRRWKESTPLRIGSLESSQRPQSDQPNSGMPDYLKGYVAGVGALGSAQLILGGETVPPGQPIFHGRLFILVDGGCISACEDFVEPFKDSGRATLVGETTQGSAGLPYTYDLHNGMSLRIAVSHTYFPDGSEFEGFGIKPDVEVGPTIESLKAGRDIALEKALELANKP
jgi:carboxyl-terminal processing protease